MTIDNIFGEYRILIDNKEVFRQKNAMSLSGKVAALRTMIGYTQRFANSMAVGIGNTANTFDNNQKFITNTALVSEVARFDVNAAFVDTSEEYSKLVFKSSIGNTIDGSTNRYLIKELGLFSPKTTGFYQRSQIVLPFELGSQLENFPSASYISTTSSFAFGDSALKIDAQSSASSTIPTQILYENNDDSFTFSYIKNSIFSSSVLLTFYSGTSSIQFLFTNNSLGNIFENKKISDKINGSLTSLEWRNVDRIVISNISAAGANNFIVADMLRFEQSPETNDFDSNLLSRVVLSTPIEKKSNEIVDIEYYLSFGFNEAI